MMVDLVQAIPLLERGVECSLAAEDWMMAITSSGDIGFAYSSQRDLARASGAFDALATLERTYPTDIANSAEIKGNLRLE